VPWIESLLEQQRKRTETWLGISLGHLGESIPFWLLRIDSRFLEEKQSDIASAEVYKDLQKAPSQYFRENFYVTSSGMSWGPVIQFVSSVLGPDRILFAADYPYENMADAVKAVAENPISSGDKEKICHENAENIL
jgi:2,3-dihydroxybenzoate decarboxylase